LMLAGRLAGAIVCAGWQAVTEERSVEARTRMQRRCRRSFIFSS
jgi:hypothetical protein